MQKIDLYIRGMHCRSCELMITEQLLKVKFVKNVKLDYRQGKAEIFYEQNEPNLEELRTKILDAGYQLGPEENIAWYSKNIADYQELGVALLIVFTLWLVLKSLGLMDVNPDIKDSTSGLLVVLLVGLTAGFSTCMALVGGLVLGISSSYAKKHPTATFAQKFRPQLFFNLGRILGYLIFGGILGALGSVFQLSTMILSFLTIIIGLVMLLMGIKLLGIFPRFENINITLPASVYRLLGIKRGMQEYNFKQALILGALTFFLPCGFTQAMQLYAISTGSFLQGSLIMGLFALGTLPGLLSIGGVTALVKGVNARRFFKVAGVVVIVFAVLNLRNGLNLSGWDLSTLPQVNTENVTLENGVQVVRMTENYQGYTPNSFTVRKGIPVKWIINSEAPFSCASTIVMPKYKINKNLSAGENIIEFTPTEVGSANFSCAMGMYTGTFNIIDN